MSENVLDDAALDSALSGVLANVFSGTSNTPPVAPGPVLILPPDLTRIHSRAGFLSGVVCRELAARPQWPLGAIMPALGTHRPLTPSEISRMFPQCPADKFLPHHWRTDTVELGRLEADWVAAQFSGVNDTGAFHMDWPVQVNRILRDGLPAKGKNIPFSLIISIGQVVPHEIAGMANHAKNIFVGTGGKEAIDKSHWLGALYGLEHLMGTTENPVRSLFDEALRRYGKILPPILWVLTVVDYSDNVRGLFCGFGRDCFESAAALAAELSIERIAPIKKAVVWLDGGEYRSTWLGNKAIYRTRRAMADGGELLILAPGLDCFGEDPGLDALIRRYGYRGTAAVRRAVAEPEIGILTAKSTTAKKARLADNLSAAAHLIHGSSEGRFTIRYCTSTAEPRGLLGRKDIESVGYEWGNLEEAAARYVPAGPDSIKPGWNKTADGETYYFIRNPGLGLWVSE